MREKCKSSLIKWEAAEMVFIACFGTLWHFVYEWSGKNFLLGLVSPVNESVFEHLKLLPAPVFLFTLLEYKYIVKLRKCLWWRKWKSMAAGTAFIAVFYYCYTGMLQKDVPWLDIASFYGAAALNSFLAYRMLQNPCVRREKCLGGCMVWAVFVFLMVLGTLYPSSDVLPGLFLSP